MYGLILVEPKEGLPKVDKEFYVMQGEFYTTGDLGKKGLQIFDAQAMLDGRPQYIVFNGRTGALAKNMNAEVGQKVRMYVGNGGVNLDSNFHVIGEIFDTVYPEAALRDPIHDVQTTLVPAGGATAVEFALQYPGNFVLVDHALARLDRGAWGLLHVTGPADKSIFDGELQSGHGH
jgi:nitrite reductase (NO-forming)